MSSPPVLLSTDIGSDIDDALALLAMLNHPEINLRGVYTVNGDVDSRACIAKQMITLSGKETVVARGEAKPLFSHSPPYSFFENWLVEDDFFDRELSEKAKKDILKPLEEVGIIPCGVEHLAEQLTKERSIVFSIAPLTNLARLIQEHPSAAQSIVHLYIMGGRLSGEIEHNFRYDITAAQIVLASDIPVTIVPGDLCSRYRLPAEQLDRLSSPAGRYVKHMAESFLAIHTAKNFISCSLHDKSLEQIIQETVHPDLSAKDYNGKKYLQSNKQKNMLLNAVRDVESAAFNGNSYFLEYNSLIDLLKDAENGFKFGSLVGVKLQQLIPDSLSIADVYIPFCHLHPEHLVTEKVYLEVDNLGRTTFKEGDKHTIVVNLDFNRFRKFLKTYLY